MARSETSNLAVKAQMTPTTASCSVLTWGDSDTVAVDNGSLLLLFLGGLDAGFFHVAD